MADKPAKARTTSSKAKAPAKGKVAKGKAAAATAVAIENEEDVELEADEAESAPAKKGKKLRALVVVESPAKANTIKKYLGAGYTVKASVGHIMDLPKSKMGVDVEHGFEPEYVPIKGKAKVLAELKKSARESNIVYLASDPDREGEAIAWHLAEEIRPANSNIKRILFNEITKRGITEAILKPLEIDQNKFAAQQARRILDRLVGYEISPILWNKVKRGLSAGRVQSVAVRLVVEREREIAAFKPIEYWTLEAELEGKNPPPFIARLNKVDGKKAEINNKVQTDDVVKASNGQPFVVEKIERKERKRNPLPPFITSRLQQEAARKLRFTAKKTMAVAQRLYEGLELGAEGSVGLITYMRTDSTRLSDDALADVRRYIGEKYGASSLPDAPIIYKTKKSAQDAHEAVRPTSTEYEPERVRKILTEAANGNQETLRDAEDYIKLYTLIWNRFVACQMKPAIYDQTQVDIGCGRLGFRASGQVLKFAGYTAVYVESSEETGSEVADDLGDGALPELTEGEKLTLKKLSPEQHFTQPPPRFSEASLVKELEEQGIGRPSTYAAILSTIQDRGYAEKREARFHPTTLGTKVNDLLVESFPDILNVQFTAQMESGLDNVEDGTADWKKLLGDFYAPFKLDLVKAATNMRDLKKEETPTDFKCPKCQSPMVIKWGKNGEFVACTAYPECKSTSEFKRKEDGGLELVEQAKTDEVCDKCGGAMIVKRGRFGEFLACAKYPECKNTKAISLGVTCPKPGCGGFLAEKRSKRGKVFFGCSNYGKTKCDFVSWDRPVPQPCPQCHAKFLVKKENKSGGRLRCLAEGCGFVQELGGPADGGHGAGSETDAA